MAFTAWIIWDILKNQGTPRAYRLVALLLYLIPYRMGMLQYTTMLFFECSFYNVCVLVPLISIDLYSCGKSQVVIVFWQVYFVQIMIIREFILKIHKLFYLFFHKIKYIYLKKRTAKSAL